MATGAPCAGSCIGDSRFVGKRQMSDYDDANQWGYQCQKHAPAHDGCLARTERGCLALPACWLRRCCSSCSSWPQAHGRCQPTQMRPYSCAPFSSPSRFQAKGAPRVARPSNCLRARGGERLTASVDQASDIAGSIPYNKGDEVLLTEVTDASGGAVFAVADRSRGGALLIALALFAAAVVAIAGAVGARALLALTVTGVVLVRFGIPALLSGASPLVVAGAIALVVGVSSVVITEGLNRRATATILGIGGALLPSR